VVCAKKTSTFFKLFFTTTIYWGVGVLYTIYSGRGRPESPGRGSYTGVEGQNLSILSGSGGDGCAYLIFTVLADILGDRVSLKNLTGEQLCQSL
jgi:hypothetical protein